MDDIHRAFTTRIPLAVMIVMGIKQWENRSHLPEPTKGLCGISCSKGSDIREYANFLAWAKSVFKPELVARLPAWNQVEGWRGKLIATCDYEAGEDPGPRVWNEGYRYWWKLSNVRMLETPLAMKGNVGMWDCLILGDKNPFVVSRDVVVLCGGKEVGRFGTLKEANDFGRKVFDAKVKELGDDVVKAEFNPHFDLCSGMVHSNIVRRNGYSLRVSIVVVEPGQEARIPGWY
jgi:hypothetical protein